MFALFTVEVSAVDDVENGQQKPQKLINTGISMCLTVHMKSTPFRNPKNRGGSPKGVRPPPIFATKKNEENHDVNAVVAFMVGFQSGRIINIAAPVVPDDGRQSRADCQQGCVQFRRTMQIAADKKYRLKWYRAPKATG